MKPDRCLVLVGADWCASCKAMKAWFLDLDLPGVALSYMDIKELPDENISSLPAILFRENGETKQVIFGAFGKADLLSKARSIFGGLE